MYIQPCDNNVNMHGLKDWSKYLKTLKQKAFDKIPNAVFNDNSSNIKIWNKIQEELSNPAQNRLLMGATAILTQPAIDYYNHKVDKETREISRNRTIAKIIAGTIAGILVRGSAHEIVKYMTNTKATSKLKKALLPTFKIDSLIKTEPFLMNYRNALSTFLAVAAMSVTNFAIDAPFTVFLTNHLNARTKEKKLLAEKEGK